MSMYMFTGGMQVLTTDLMYDLIEVQQVCSSVFYIGMNGCCMLSKGWPYLRAVKPSREPQKTWKPIQAM